MPVTAEVATRSKERGNDCLGSIVSSPAFFSRRPISAMPRKRRKVRAWASDAMGHEPTYAPQHSSWAGSNRGRKVANHLQLTKGSGEGEFAGAISSIVGRLHSHYSNQLLPGKLGQSASVQVAPMKPIIHSIPDWRPPDTWS